MIITPPHKIPDKLSPKSVFLAGSIEMGKAEDWQTGVAQKFDEIGWTVLNPRRPDWDPSWEQSIHFKPFRDQVEWEMLGLALAREILFYFSPGTLSPITLLEFGYVTSLTGFATVVCPEGFWRKGNIDIMCEKLQIDQAYTLDDAFRLITTGTALQPSTT